MVRYCWLGIVGIGKVTSVSRPYAEPKVVEVQHMEINTNESKEVLEKEDIDTFDKIMNAWHKKGKFDYIGTINEGMTTAANNGSASLS